MERRRFHWKCSYWIHTKRWTVCERKEGASPCCRVIRHSIFLYTKPRNLVTAHCYDTAWFNFAIYSIGCFYFAFVRRISQINVFPFLFSLCTTHTNHTNIDRQPNDEPQHAPEPEEAADEEAETTSSSFTRTILRDFRSDPPPFSLLPCPLSDPSSFCTLSESSARKRIETKAILRFVTNWNWFLWGTWGMNDFEFISIE